MTIDVYRGRKTTMQQQQQQNHPLTCNKVKTWIMLPGNFSVKTGAPDIVKG